MFEVASEPERRPDCIQFVVSRDGVELGRIHCLRDSPPIYLAQVVTGYNAQELIILHNKIQKLDAVRLRKARERASRQNLRG